MQYVAALVFLALFSCTTPATRDQYMLCESYCYVDKACVSSVSDWLICDCHNGDRIRVSRWSPEPRYSDNEFYLIPDFAEPDTE